MSLLPPEEFLTHAEWLLEQDDTEINRRSAVSRAYYFAFHECKNIAVAKNLVSFGCSHQKLIDTMVVTREFKRIGLNLDRLKKRRHKADYHLHLPITRREAADHIKEAKRLKLQLEQCVPASKASGT